MIEMYCSNDPAKVFLRINCEPSMIHLTVDIEHLKKGGLSFMMFPGYTEVRHKQIQTQDYWNELFTSFKSIF